MTPVLRTLLTVIAIGALIYVALCVALFLAQRSFIYYPQRRSAANCNPTFKLNVDDADVRVCMISRQGTDAVIYFGGNAEDVSQSLPTLSLAFPERSVYAMNYRGYGGSTGKPSETALVADALALFDRVHSDHPRVTVIGRSLGSGVAVHVAAERQVERLVLITPYDSLLRIAAGQFGYFPLNLLMLDKFESWRYAPRVTAPTQLIAAQNDEVIPLSSTRALLEHFIASRASLTVIPGASHNTISESPEYIRLLAHAP